MASRPSSPSLPLVDEPLSSGARATVSLLAGLTLKRVASVTVIALLVAASMVWFFQN